MQLYQSVGFEVRVLILINRKGVTLRRTLTIFIVAVLCIIAGCNGGNAVEKELFTIDFHEGQTLRYKFVSTRSVVVNWGRVGKGRRNVKDKVDKFFESMDTIVAYTPVEIDPYGLTTVKATCESVTVKRNPQKSRRRDPAEGFAGKTFTFTVGPAGKIADYSQLRKLLAEVGKKAYRQGPRGGKIKDLDMIVYFVATQWYCWDPACI